MTKRMIQLIRRAALAGLFVSAFVAGQCLAAPLSVYDATVEFRDNPLAVEEAAPRLGWKLRSGENGTTITAKQIEAATSCEVLQAGKADLWDSGWIEGGEPNTAAYAGKPLAPGQAAWWRVRVRDGSGQASAWSEPVFWRQAPGVEDWQGEWIGASVKPYTLGTTDAPVWSFRKSFDWSSNSSDALLYLAVAGIVEVRLNGKPVDDRVLAPMLRDLRHKVPYLTYDLSEKLRQGENTLEVRLGSGFVNVASEHRYGYNHAPYRMASRFRAMLAISGADGLETVFTSDDTWRKVRTEITYHCFFGGEFIDHRIREQEPDWEPILVLQAPQGKLVPETMPPCRVTETFHPISITEPKPGTYVADMGVNFTGWIRFEGRGEVGQQVRIHSNEILTDDGTVNTQNLRIVPQGDPYHDLHLTFAGTGRERFEPRFSFQSGRYVQIEGLEYRPKPGDITGCAVHNDFAWDGAFTCSSGVINRLQKATRRTFRNNWIGTQFDCPQREKTSWLGDFTRSMQATIYNFGMASSYAKVAQDIYDAQYETGSLPYNAPLRSRVNPDLIDAWWQGDAWRLPWLHYLFYGDRSILEEHYAGMVAFMDFFSERHPYGFTEIGIRSTAPPYGDHCSVGFLKQRRAYDKAREDGVPKKKASKLFRTPHDLLGAIGTYDGARTIARIADVLGKNADVEKYNRLAKEIRERIELRMDETSGAYAEDSQTLQALALFYGIPQPKDRAKVLDYLKRNITETWEGHLSTGTIATRQLFRTLSENGEGELALSVMHQPGYPGYVALLDKGMTAIWENFDLSFTVTTSSRNHPALGGIGDWFYADLAGIQPDPEQPGFANVIFRPDIICGLDYASAEYDTVRGLVRSAWYRKGDEIVLNVSTPPGSTGEVRLPSGPGIEIKAPAEAKPSKESGKFRQWNLPSGTYKFTIHLPQV